LLNKETTLSNLGRREEAISYYDKVLAIEPGNMDALNNKGNALDNLGRYEEAIKYYDKAIEINPNLAIVREKRDLAYKQLENSAHSTGYGKPEKSRWKRLFGK
jgi:tetratricopeptide (TPR) repeat protein